MNDVRALRYDIKWDEWQGQLITDINFKYYDMVIEFMWENSFLKNIVYEGLGFYEMDDMKKIYSDYVRHILRNECSVMMLNPDATQIVAVVLLEWMTEEWHSWVYLPSSIPKGLFQQLITMKQELMRSTKEKLELDNFDSLVVHELALPEDLYIHKDFLMCLFDVFGFVAQHMHMPRVCFIALSNMDQESASLAEYDEIGRTIYSIYKVDNKRPFDILRELDEMYAVLFELPVEPILKYIYMPGFEAVHEEMRLRELKMSEFD
ncbi:uncharacterized protein LOC115626007 [Scaptodrosophila lebanonensis]|uniref:Uncharacterized protein LOC115626007 n=1 Tax=Drosophila lebanonensis TaxID=7225 RepID=A0A6J2TNM0_DROLE|nr:uncharacterized protein LOC115626007 [Scaptodrosophila lebanonensis]